MLRIRLTRTGKKAQPSFRLVVAEHARPVKRKYLERLGQYVPALKDKPFTIKKERIEYWLSQGAQPSDTVATLLKKEGFEKMDQYIGRRDLERKKKKEKKEEGGAEAKAEGEAPAKDKAEAPAEADAPAKSEAPKDEAKTETKPEAKADAPAEKAEPPKEEPPKEEPPKEDPPKEDPPKEDPPKEA